MDNQKQFLRKQYIKTRKMLTSSEVLDKSAVITAKLLNMEEFKASQFIMCYVDFNNEVSTRVFIDACFRCKKRVAIPYITQVEGVKEMRISEIESDGMDSLLSGMYGILEPSKDALKDVQPDKIDMVIVPGVVFDEVCNRIGYGAGYFDVFLRKVRPDCIKVGIAYKFQVIPNVPHDEGDAKMDVIITD